MTALLLPGIAFPEVMTCSPGYLQRRSTRCSIVSIPGWSMARLKHGFPMAPHAYWVAVSRGQCARRSEEHTSELQSLMRISYAVFCLTKKNNKKRQRHDIFTNRHIQSQKD